jgi:hypothetical protein
MDEVQNLLAAAGETLGLGPDPLFRSTGVR